MFFKLVLYARNACINLKIVSFFFLISRVLFYLLLEEANVNEVELLYGAYNESTNLMKYKAMVYHEMNSITAKPQNHFPF